MVRSRYARGAVEVRGAIEISLWCGGGMLMVQSRYTLGAVEVSSLCNVRSWCG